MLTQHVKSIKEQYPSYNSDQVWSELMGRYPGTYAGKTKADISAEIIDTMRFLAINPTWQPSTIQPVASSSNSLINITNQQLANVVYIKKQFELEGNPAPTPIEIFERYKHDYPGNSIQLSDMEHILQYLRQNPFLNQLDDETLNQLKLAYKQRWEVKQAIRALQQHGNANPTIEEIIRYVKGTSIWKGQAEPTLHFNIKRAMEFLRQHPDFIYVDESAQVQAGPEVISELNNFRWNVLQTVKSMRKDGAVITPGNIESHLVSYWKIDTARPYRSHELQQKIQEALDYLQSHPNFSYSHHRPKFDPIAIIGQGEAIQSGGVDLTELGINRSLPEILKFITTPAHFTEQYRYLGTSPSKIALLVMPEGFDVNLIIKSLALDQNMKLYGVDAVKYLTDQISLDTALDNVLTEAVEGAPSIIHIRQLDRLFRYLNDAHSRIILAKRTLEFQRFLDKIRDDERQILVIATVQSDDMISELTRAEYFSTQIRIPLPDNESREAMFKGMSSHRNVSENILEPNIIQEIISHTPGYTQADLKLLFDVASNFAIERVQSSQEPLHIEIADIRRAILQIKPLSVQSGASTIPNVSWNDLGGLFKVKEEIFSTIMYPLKYPEVYKKFGITQSSGVILYGPPGTGKTMIAKAVANDATANFIAVKPSDIFSKYMGESEVSVRKFFARAAALAPCVLFFDEFESIGSVRTSGGEACAQARNSTITQLLVEMDGIQSRNGVYLLAATNRLDAVDPAFLRPGRFDKHIFVGLPIAEERESILDVAINELRLNGIEIEQIDTKIVATYTEGLSAADLAALVREAASLAAQDFISSMSGYTEPVLPKITADHFRRSLQKIQQFVSTSSN